MPTVNDIVKRGDDRLQALYETVERGEPVNWNRIALLEDIEQVQIGRAFVQEAIDRNNAADKNTEQLLRESVK